MRRLLIVSAALFLSANILCSAEAPRLEKPFVHEQKKALSYPEKSSLRIATWSIEWFPAGMRKNAKENVQWQIAAVASLIKELKPDILLTQQTRNLGSLAALNENLGSGAYNFLASSCFDKENLESEPEDRIQRQTGILSRPSWQEIWEIDFSGLSGTDRPAHGWLAARYEIGQLRFVVYNGFSFHGDDSTADRPSSYGKRLAAIQELRRDLDRRGLDPYRDKILVCGDFSTDFFAREYEGEKTFTELRNMGFNHSFGGRERSEIITVPARDGDAEPAATFDYIWFSSGWGDAIPAAHILSKGASKRKNVFGGDERGLASSHYPVFVDIPLESNP